MHLIPLAHISPTSAKEQYRRQNSTRYADGEEGDLEDLDDFISSQDAIKVLRDPLEKTQVSDAVEAAVWQRISEYAITEFWWCHLR